MIVKHQIIQFIVMFLVGISLNPMNLLVFRVKDLYLSLTLVYGGLIMASNMIWAHELVHYFVHGHINLKIILLGISLSIFFTYIVRKQYLVNDKQWLKRMISHHSTALTTSHKILNKTNNNKVQKLSNDIIDTQEREITLMKKLIKNN